MIEHTYVLFLLKFMIFDQHICINIYFIRIKIRSIPWVKGRYRIVENMIVDGKMSLNFKLSVRFLVIILSKIRNVNARKLKYCSYRDKLRWRSIGWRSWLPS